MITLDRDGMYDLLTGCAFMGTGGGGEFDAGMRYVDLALAAGKQFKIASMDELDNSTMTCTPYVLGCTTASDRTESQKRLPNATKPPVALAIEALSKFCGKDFGATVACELGAENTAVAAYAAAMSDGILIDGDAAGRAVPEITHSTFYLNDLPLSPMVLANHFGETIICDDIFDDVRAEEIAREFSKISCNDIAGADHPMSIEKLKGNIVTGSISKSLDIGKVLNDQNLDALQFQQKLTSITNGTLIFKGIVEHVSSRELDGFTTGKIIAHGFQKHEGKVCQIDFKNEFMIARIDQQVVVTIPDLICCINRKTRRPITNPHTQSNDPIDIYVLPAPAHFTTDRGLDIFGPQYVDLRSPFKPFVDTGR